MAGKGGNGNGLLIGAAVAGGLLLVYKKWIKPGVVVPLQTQAYVERMRIGEIRDVKFKKDTVEFKFPIENPNNKPMTIDAIVGDIYVKDATRRPLKIGTVAHYGHDVIKALGATNFDLVVKVKVVNEFVYLSQLFSGQIKGVTATFEGTVNANNRPWPVKETMYLQ